MGDMVAVVGVSPVPSRTDFALTCWTLLLRLSCEDAAAVVSFGGSCMFGESEIDDDDDDDDDEEEDDEDVELSEVVELESDDELLLLLLLLLLVSLSIRRAR